MKTYISAILICLGIAMMAGSAGDCDGKCMENAMSIGDTILYGLLGLGMMVTGLFIGGAFNAEE